MPADGDDDDDDGLLVMVHEVDEVNGVVSEWAEVSIEESPAPDLRSCSRRA